MREHNWECDTLYGHKANGFTLRLYFFCWLHGELTAPNNAFLNDETRSFDIPVNLRRSTHFDTGNRLDVPPQFAANNQRPDNDLRL